MFQIDVMSRTPVYEQIKEQLEKFILNGNMSPGEQIPSVRSMSMELSINPNTILKAYSELDVRGLIHSVPGKGYFVCENALEVLTRDKLSSLGVLTEKLAEMALAGVPKEEILKCVDLAYEKNSKKMIRQNREELQHD